MPYDPLRIGETLLHEPAVAVLRAEMKALVDRQRKIELALRAVMVDIQARRENEAAERAMAADLERELDADV